MLKIVHVPNSVLTTPAKRIPKIDGSILKLVKEMEKTLNAQVDPEGVGLAAPQVGVGKALFIIKPNPDSPIEAFVNPEILEVVIDKKKAKKDALEGCLSIPRIWSPVRRSHKVFLKYQSLEGATLKEWFKGFEAVIIQHEVDHLNGVLFTQRALEQDAQLYEEKNGELKKMNSI